MGTMARRQGVQVLLGRVKFALCVICPSGDVKQVTGHEFGVWGSGWREGFGVYQPISGTENHGVGWITRAECLEREEAEAQDPGLSFQQAVKALSLGAGLAMRVLPSSLSVLLSPAGWVALGQNHKGAQWRLLYQ